MISFFPFSIASNAAVKYKSIFRGILPLINVCVGKSTWKRAAQLDEQNHYHEQMRQSSWS